MTPSVSPLKAAAKACPQGAFPGTILAIAALAVLIRAAMAVATHFTQEDFLITLRYAENIAHGHGFVFNVGERVLGTTTPLYTLLLAAVSRLGLPAAAVGKATNILADGVLCLVVYRWLSRLGWEAAGYWGAFLIAVNPILIRVSISGQESSLVALCGAVVWLCYAERRFLPAYAIAALLFLLRWDSLLLTGVMTGAIIVRERRLPVRELALFALLCAPWLLFAACYFGSPIPVTLAAKTAVYGWYFRFQHFPELPRLLFRLVGTPLYSLMTLAAVLGAGRLIWERQQRSALLPPLIWFFIYWMAFLVSKVLLFEWYLVPPLFVYEMFAAVGVVTVLGVLHARWSQPIWVAVALVMACVLGGLNVWQAFFYTRALQGLEDGLRKPMGLWLGVHSQATDRVMLEPIGYVGYFSRLRVVDMTGLVTPSVIRDYDPKNPCPWLSIVLAYRPEWCIIRPYESDLMRRVSQAANQSWAHDYHLVRSFSYSAHTGGPPTVFEVYRRNSGVQEPIQQK